MNVVSAPRGSRTLKSLVDWFIVFGSGFTRAAGSVMAAAAPSDVVYVKTKLRSARSVPSAFVPPFCVIRRRLPSS